MRGVGTVCAVALAALVTVAGAGVSRAEKGSGGTSHEGHEGPEAHKSGDKAPAAPAGVAVRETKVQGNVFSYRVYTWEERNVMMKGMEGHAMAGMDDSGRSTNHLMLFVTGPDGKQLAGGKVGFVVTGPDKAEFKTLTMAMSGGYGADVPLKARGDHAIRTKAVFGDKTLTDEFTYTVK